jgi:hypothetical protein
VLSWWQLAVAVFLAIMFTQVGFLGHDAGHRQIFRSRKANYVLGVLLGNLSIGLSYDWWVSKHNRHHARPNQRCCWKRSACTWPASARCPGGPTSVTGPGRRDCSQFMPGATSPRCSWSSPRSRRWSSSSCSKDCFGLYLGSSFAPNHKGMPILDATDRSGFLHRQVLTSYNVRGGWLTDLALGGLN